MQAGVHPADRCVGERSSYFPLLAAVHVQVWAPAALASRALDVSGGDIYTKAEGENLS